MRKRVFRMVVVLMLLIFLLFNNMVEVSANSFQDKNIVEKTLMFETDTITQKDYDSNFANYASKRSTASVKIKWADTDKINVVGVVKDYDTEQLISGAIIDCGNKKKIMTDENGRFQIRGYSAGIYSWTVNAQNYCEAVYEGYELFPNDTVILTFYISDKERIYYNRKELLSQNHNEQEISCDEMLSSQKLADLKGKASMSTPPSVSSSIDVFYNGSVRKVGRQVYIYTVVSSELYAPSEYSKKGMTNYQIKQLYIAQAEAANTFLEYSLKVYPKHKANGYEVCSTACCQVYDPTCVYMEAVDATADIFYYAGGIRRTNIVMYHPDNTYQYIWGAFFSHCKGKGTLDRAGEPALKDKTCSDLWAPKRDTGHRYGMCQMGAAKMAKDGNSAGTIIHYYYSDCTIAACPLN